MWLPVLDYKNNPIKNPSAMAINTTMMRCLVKAIAMHGLGLYIYAGEDLPDGKEPEESQANIEQLQNVLNAIDGATQERWALIKANAIKLGKELTLDENKTHLRERIKEKQDELNKGLLETRDGNSGSGEHAKGIDSNEEKAGNSTDEGERDDSDRIPY